MTRTTQRCGREILLTIQQIWLKTNGSRAARPARAKLVRVEARIESVLERGVLCRLLQVAMHVTSRREDKLDALRQGRRCEVLLDHLCERGPLGLPQFPPLKHVNIHGVGHFCVRQVLLELIQLRRILPHRSEKSSLSGWEQVAQADLALLRRRRRRRRRAWQTGLQVDGLVAGLDFSSRCRRSWFPHGGPLTAELAERLRLVARGDDLEPLDEVVLFEARVEQRGDLVGALGVNPWLIDSRKNAVCLGESSWGHPAHPLLSSRRMGRIV